MNSESLLPARFLFRFAVPCRYKSPLWSETAGAELDAKYALPSLDSLEGRIAPIELRAAWSEEGLAFALEVRSKHQTPWCHEGRIDESDGLRVWIDTRDTHNIHRASRFCHQFAILPMGRGRSSQEPMITPVLINRAKEHPRAIPSDSLAVRSKVSPHGYTLEALLGARSLTGFDTAEHPKIGFQFAVVDREIGTFTFAIGPGMPYQEDPSLWGTLELAR
jgi:hypothetical protein